MFLETSYGYLNDVSYLVSPRFTNVKAMEFYIHMYGATMGTLSVEAYVGSSWRVVWSKSGAQSGSQTQAFRKEVLNLPSGTTQVRFKGVKGSSYTGMQELWSH